MRHLLLFLSLIWTSFTLSAQSQELFQLANEAYQKGDYEEAIAIYDSILAQGQESVALYYNLGNAHYQQGALAPAILNYEKALHLKPGDEETLHNLKLAEQKRVDRFEELPPNLFKAFRLGILKAFQPDTWAVIGLVFLGLTAIGLALYFFSGIPRIGFSLGLISIVLGLFSLWMSFQHQRYLENHPAMIVMSESAYVKSGPGKGAEDLFILHAGTKVEQIEIYETWTKIKLIDGKIGWLPESNLESIY